MKFIDSTNLKQWADKMEASQILPELVQKLIDCSNAVFTEFTLPVGDAVYKPGWDGVVNSDRQIDLVPKGLSLWEFGKNNEVKSKIEGDFNKRVLDSLGYDKNNSTFVFVTPRIWYDQKKWMDEHIEQWGNIVIYTAVELERWIEQHPSVGIWLAHKLGKISSSIGVQTPEMYWDVWAQCKDVKLPYEILLPGRDIFYDRIIDACNNHSVLYLRSYTHSECIAFAIATIMTCKEKNQYKSKVVVATDANVYNDLVEKYEDLIIITDIQNVNYQYARSKGHTVIVSSTPADVDIDAETLHFINRDAFVKILVSLRIDEEKSKAIARDTIRDINVLRRRFECKTDEKWMTSDNLNVLYPYILIGRWNGFYKYDNEILEKITDKSLSEIELELQKILYWVDSPLLHFVIDSKTDKAINKWRIKSPYEAVEILLRNNNLRTFDLMKYLCDTLIVDDCPADIDLFEGKGLHSMDHKYSPEIKLGVYQTLVLIAINSNENNCYQKWVDNQVGSMFKDWTLGRLLSNRYYMKLLAEASPESFLSFLEDESNSEIIKKIFEPQQGFFNSWNVYYTDILFALEAIAWDENYFSSAVKLLLKFSEIENNSNEHNRPINSLKNIFHLQLPQTYVNLDSRINVLKRIARKSPDLHTFIFDICVSMLRSLGPNSIFPSSHFKWRTYDNSRGRDVLQNGCGDDLKTIIELLLQCCDFSKDEVCKLIDLSIDPNIFPFNNLIINFLKDYSVDKVVDIEIVDKLRNNIVRHLNHPTAKWSMKAKQLQPHQELLSLIEPKDLILKYLWLFDYKVEIPYNKRDEITELLLEKRKNVIREVFESDNELRIWEMVKSAKNSYAVAEPLVALYGDSQKDIVCELFKNDSINDKFVSEYLNRIYCLNPKSYTTWAESVVRADNAMSFVLYLIWYYKEISDH